jgi:outer membrane protein assembly factor BamB
LILAAAVLAVLWNWPAEDWERMYRVTATWLTCLLTFILLGIWLLFLSGLSWLWRLGILLLVPLAALAAVREVKFTGDMEPVIDYRWSPPQDDLVEAHRRRQPPAEIADKTAFPAIQPVDYPEYRGRARDGVVTGPALARDWRTKPPRLRWRQPCGGGYASFAVVGDYTVTLEQRRDQEIVVCYDAATGQERWEHAYPARFSEVLGGEGPRATPTIADGEVYSLGAAGHLVCLDAASGRLKWSVDILENKDNNVRWGMSGSPLVYDRVVVVNPGKQQKRAAGTALVAYDRATGKPVWSSGNTRAGYSSPMLATLAGKRQILLFDGEGLAGFDAAEGKELWRYDWETQQWINVAQPVVLDGDRVFVSSGYGVGCAMLKITFTEGKWGVEPLWRNKAMRCKFTSPVLYEGHLYGLDEGILACVDAETGRRLWKGNRYDHGQLLRTRDLLVILSETGKLALVEATPTALRELGVIDALEGKTWNHLALANGVAYVRNHREMACYELAE